MNATAIEDGAPFIFTSTAFGNADEADPARLRGAKEFNTYNDGQFRIRVSTAARLSASFPYVAPAARSNAHVLAPDYHMVDGGYYDNFGVRSALDWLVEAGPQSLPESSKIALVEIRWGDPSYAGGSIRGWNYQGLAPLWGVLQVRSKGQLRDDKVAMEAFQQSWKEFAKDKPFVFAYKGKSPCDHQPLSWKLTLAQRECVEATWSDSEIQKEADRLEKFLK